MCFFTYSSKIIAILCWNINAVLISGNTFDSTILFYNGNSSGTFKSYDLATADVIVNDPNFNLTRTTMLFIHGYDQSPSSPGSRVLIEAYITNGNYNNLVLDWSSAASGLFSVVVSRVDVLGREVALFFDRLNIRGVEFANMHIVGHSLGAHMGGSAGRHTIAWSGSTKFIDRISGLDPANLFPDILSWHHARFVDIIHTDASGLGLGTNQNSGHVDFWPNNGRAIQPGCPLLPIFMEEIACSHLRALLFWAETVRRKEHVSFLSINRDNPSIIIQMGNNCPTSYVQGTYNLETNRESWFSRS